LGSKEQEYLKLTQRKGDLENKEARSASDSTKLGNEIYKKANNLFRKHMEKL
jgi:hypothetical protein